MSINGYVPFLINLLDTIVRGETCEVVTTSSCYLLHAAGEYSILLML